MFKALSLNPSNEGREGRKEEGKRKKNLLNTYLTDWGVSLENSEAFRIIEEKVVLEGSGTYPSLCFYTNPIVFSFVHSSLEGSILFYSSL
jgi:hypothetical protein